VVFLTLYHVKLLQSGLTTNENLKDLYKRSYALPISSLGNFCENFKLKILKPIKPSLISNGMLTFQEDAMLSHLNTIQPLSKKNSGTKKVAAID
jgi:hypothetical protein